MAWKDAVAVESCGQWAIYCCIIARTQERSVHGTGGGRPLQADHLIFIFSFMLWRTKDSENTKYKYLLLVNWYFETVLPKFNASRRTAILWNTKPQIPRRGEPFIEQWNPIFIAEANKPFNTKRYFYYIWQQSVDRSFVRAIFSEFFLQEIVSKKTENRV